MNVIIDTVLLRPYVFGFMLAFVIAGIGDLGWRRTLRFAAWVLALAWVAEFTSTRIGVPFGLYHYTGTTQGRELYLANVPLMDPLSFTFLAYAAFCLARLVLIGRDVSRITVAIVAGLLMMLLDVVMDPVAVRGDRWFLGHIFYYPEGGVYFGVPLSNFVGWWIVGLLGVGGYLFLDGRGSGAAGRGRRPGPGVALYYGVLAFNLVVTVWIGEWVLAGTGLALHGIVALTAMGVPRAVWAPRAMLTDVADGAVEAPSD